MTVVLVMKFPHKEKKAGQTFALLRFFKFFAIKGLVFLSFHVRVNSLSSSVNATLRNLLLC